MQATSRYLGTEIAMCYRDHLPPHFRAICVELEATVEAESGQVNGERPSRAMAHIQERRSFHKQELVDTWKPPSTSKPP